MKTKILLVLMGCLTFGGQTMAQNPTAEAALYTRYESIECDGGCSDDESTNLAYTHTILISPQQANAINGLTEFTLNFSYGQISVSPFMDGSYQEGDRSFTVFQLGSIFGETAGVLVRVQWDNQRMRIITSANSLNLGIPLFKKDQKHIETVSIGAEVLLDGAPDIFASALYAAGYVEAEFVKSTSEGAVRREVGSLRTANRLPFKQ